MYAPNKQYSESQIQTSMDFRHSITVWISDIVWNPNQNPGFRHFFQNVSKIWSFGFGFQDYSEMSKIQPQSLVFRHIGVSEIQTRKI